ncbi:DUF3237 domain-containing protein [Candidatus Protofrankia californiensis]|uniref:DUF3237 domain-containing protein n=1 Tax=Candidatus Protofrankia californiensis TaxID=1839754 RepID=UPI0019CF6451|nr:DUF3237 domain-containing protein [Candidatus Protofrankia californiensis]
MSTLSTPVTSELRLVEEFAVRAEIRPPLEVGSGPFGSRMIFELVAGRATGERFNAEVLSGGADWALIGPDGLARIDVRSQFRTDDGAFVYVQYHGLIEMNEAVGAALATGGETGFGDQYFRTTPRFETGDERYSWLNRRVFLAAGRIVPGGIEYRIHRVD